MGDHQHQAFVRSRRFGAGMQMRRQPTLGTAEYALHMPTPPVFFRGEVTLHFATVSASGGRLWPSTMVDRDDRFANLPVLPAASVKLLGIVRGVAQQATNAGVLDRLGHGRQKARGVIAWTVTHHSRQDQMAAVIGHDGELKVTTKATSPARTRAAIDEVSARVVRLKAGRVNAGLTCRRQQLQLVSPTKDFS